jgi:hypothetical protein
MGPEYKLRPSGGLATLLLVEPASQLLANQADSMREVQ